MINFKEHWDLDSIPLNALISNDFYDSKEGAWYITQKDCKSVRGNTLLDVGATASAIIALKKYADHTGIKEYNNYIDKGVDWLVDRQDPESGGWGHDNIDTFPRVDKTCHAIQALLKKGFSYEKNIEIIKGINFLKNRLNKFDGELGETRLFLWEGDDYNSDDNEKLSGMVRNSSLAISTFLKANTPYYNNVIQNSLISLLKLHNKNKYDIDTHFNSAYFYCTLIDYLKAAKSPSLFYID